MKLAELEQFRLSTGVELTQNTKAHCQRKRIQWFHNASKQTSPAAIDAFILPEGALGFFPEDSYLDGTSDGISERGTFPSCGTEGKLGLIPRRPFESGALVGGPAHGPPRASGPSAGTHRSAPLCAHATRRQAAQPHQPEQPALHNLAAIPIWSREPEKATGKRTRGGVAGVPARLGTHTHNLTTSVENTHVRTGGEIQRSCWRQPLPSREARSF